jgi:prolyl-tRNA editing enzyme YbaK/EbsC (Cys-tRNA(Pro) deacylase)
MAAKIDPAIHQVLQQSSASYEILDCDPELADTAVFCEHYGYPPEKSANAILVKAKTGEQRFVVCVLLASTRLDVNKTVRKRIGARRVSFASQQETREQTGMELGGVTPLGLPAQIELWVDQRIAELDYVILGAGTRAAKIKVSPQIFLTTPNTAFVEGLGKEPAPVD